MALPCNSFSLVYNRKSVTIKFRSLSEIIRVYYCHPINYLAFFPNFFCCEKIKEFVNLDYHKSLQYS